MIISDDRLVDRTRLAACPLRQKEERRAFEYNLSEESWKFFI
jgi:hypothetical protein